MISLKSFKKLPFVANLSMTKHQMPSATSYCITMQLTGIAYHKEIFIALFYGVTSSLPNYPGVRAHTLPWITIWLWYRDAFWSLTVQPRSHCADLAVAISTIWKIVDIGMVGSWSRGNIILTSWKSAWSGNDRQWSGSQYDKVLL